MGATKQIPSQAAVYEFSDAGLKFIDSNNNGVFDKGDKVKVVTAKKEFFVDLAKKDAPQVVKLKESLFGKKAEASLAGLHFSKAQEYLSHRAKAAKLTAAIEAPESSRDLAEVYVQAQDSLKQARHIAGALFDTDPRAQGKGELAAMRQALDLSAVLTMDTVGRAQQEGNVTAARKVLKETELRRTFETQVKKMLGELKTLAKEQGRDAAEARYKACLVELKAEGTPKDIRKNFKKGFALLLREIPKKPEPSPTVTVRAGGSGAAGLILEGENFKAKLDAARLADHHGRAVAACASIKEIFGREGLAASSAKQVKVAKTAYAAAYAEYAEIRNVWESMKGQYAGLSFADKKLHYAQMTEWESRFQFYQQSVAGTYQSARVATRDHNYYFPTEKLKEPLSPEDKLGKSYLEKQEFPPLLAAKGKKKNAGS